MKGRINHLIVNVNRYEEAQRFSAGCCRKSAIQIRWVSPKTPQAGKRMVQRRRLGLGARGRATFSRRPIPSSSRGALRNRFRRRQSPPGG